MTSFGIDFGTTNSVLAMFDGGTTEVVEIDTPTEEWADLGYSKVLPTVFAVDDQNQPLFGWEAKREPARVEAVKRLFNSEEEVMVGGRAFLVEDVATLIFAHIRRAAEAKGVMGLDRAMVTVPANSLGIARARTKITAGMAGIQVQGLINEPTAAAMAFGRTVGKDMRIMVVDWGGGTLDVTILEIAEGVFVERASAGIGRCGGVDFDNRLKRELDESVGDKSDWSAADRVLFDIDVEKAKILLSAADETMVPVPGGEYRRVTRKAFNDAVATLVQRVREPIERCFADLRMSGQDLDAVVLVGGTCNVPAVRSFVSDLVGKEPATGVNPMTAIAEGAAIASAILSREIDSEVFVSIEHALGTLALSQSGDGLEFSEIISKNHPLPASNTETFFPVRDQQELVNIRLVEGDPGDYTELAGWEVPISPRALGESSFELTYEYDVDGIVHVKLVDTTTGESLLETEASPGVAADPADLVKMAKRAKETLDSGQVQPPGAAPSAGDPEIAELAMKARAKVVPFLEPDEAEALTALVDSAEGASTDQERDAAKASLKTELSKYSYLF